MEQKTNATKFRPAGKRILILPDEYSNVTAGGIMIPDTAKERPQTGTVIGIGPEVTMYQVGDRILYGKTAGIHINFEDENSPADDKFVEYWLMQESELFGTL